MGCCVCLVGLEGRAPELVGTRAVAGGAGEVDWVDAGICRCGVPTGALWEGDPAGVLLACVGC